jgi:hypothetical protein
VLAQGSKDQEEQSSIRFLAALTLHKQECRCGDSANFQLESSQSGGVVAGGARTRGRAGLWRKWFRSSVRGPGLPRDNQTGGRGHG